MKRICFLSLILSFMFVMNISKSFAEDCYGCDDAKPWIPGTEWVISPYLGCDIYIQYEYKKCSDTRGSIRIVDIAVYPQNCGLTDHDIIMNRAIRQMIEDASSILGIPAPGQGWVLDIVTKQCWHYDNYPNQHVSPCTPNDECCHTKYAVHTVGGLGNLTVVDEILSTTQDLVTECENNPNPAYPAGDDCYIMCDNHIMPLDYPVIYEPFDDLCMGNCGASFQPDRTITGFYSTGCTINTFTSIRMCNGVLEVKIDGIALSGSQWSIYDPNNGAVFMNAVKRILYSYYQMGYSTITIRTPSCWERNSGIFTRCGDDCCDYTYDLYENSAGQVLCSSVTPGTFSSVTCVSPCFNVCSYLNITPFVPLPSAKITNGENINIGEKTIVPESMVIPNPANDETEIKLYTDTQGKAELKVYNIIGQEVLNSVINRTSKLSSWKFNTSNFIDGPYFYAIIVDGKTIINGNFVVTH